MTLSIFSNIIAKEPVAVFEYKYAGPYTVTSPFRIDKEDINGTPWSNKKLSQTAIDIHQIDKSQTIITADSTGMIVLPQDSTQNRLHLFRFVVDADRYLKSQIEILGTGLFEVFVGDEQKGSNTYKAKDTDDADPVYVNMEMLPQQYSITIKYLTEAGKKDTIRLKSSIKLTSSDTTAIISTQAESKRKITLQDIIEGRRLSNASISPSGNYYIISYYEFYATEKSSTTYELRELKNNRLIYRFPTSESPAWMPVSDKVYFWRKGIKESDLVTLDVQNIQEKVLMEGIKVAPVMITPNEQHVILTKEEKAPEAIGSLKRLLAPDDRIAGFRNKSSLYRYNIQDKTLEQLTFGNSNTYVADISGDSKMLLFYTHKRDLSQQPFADYSFYIMNLDDLKTDTILQNDRYTSNAQFSPDGKQVLFTGNSGAFNKIGENLQEGETANGYDIQSFVMDLSTKEVNPITKNFNPSIAAAHWWAGDNMIYFRTIDKDKERMYRYNPKDKRFELLPLQEDIIQKFSLPNKGNIALYVGQSVSNSNKLYSYQLKSGKSVLLSDPFAEQSNKLQLGEVYDFDFSLGKDTIEGRYYLPPNFDKDKKYPVIVYYYGGTTPTPRRFESRYPLHVYAALGYVVYTLQPSGAIGFGQEFSARHVNAWGKRTANEIIEGTKRFCEAHPFVDKDKIGCIGASYGGFMTQYLQTQTDIFAAAVSHAGISNIASYWGEGYWGYTYSSYASAGSYPWNNAELYVEQSPLFHADKINTPLLLLHGTADTNVPVGESIQMFNALKILGKDVEFIQVNGENHAITAYKKRLEWNNHIFAWFAKWLKDDPAWWDSLK